MANPASTQDYNRYSYCVNNPLGFTDPSGYKALPNGNFEIYVTTILDERGLVIGMKPYNGNATEGAGYGGNIFSIYINAISHGYMGNITKFTNIYESQTSKSNFNGILHINTWHTFNSCTGKTEGHTLGEITSTDFKTTIDINLNASGGGGELNVGDVVNGETITGFSGKYPLRDLKPGEGDPITGVAPCPAFKSEAIYSVYQGIKNGKVVYWGMTKNFLQRELQHGGRFDQLVKVYENLSRSAARGLEQLHIDKTGLQNLENTINGIGVKNPRLMEYYQEAIRYLQGL